MMHRFAPCSLIVLITLGPGASLFAQSPSPAPRELQSLVNDTAFQLELNYRFNVPELTRRREEVGKAIALWNESSRSEADNRQLSDWLRGTIRASMPGSREPLPPLPKFEKRVEALTSDGAPATSRDAGTTEFTNGRLPPSIGNRSGASEHTVIRPASAVSEDKSAPGSKLQGSDVEYPRNDFWNEHPASQGLPADLIGGDPFEDDPLPTVESLPADPLPPAEDSLPLEESLPPDDSLPADELFPWDDPLPSDDELFFE